MLFLPGFTFELMKSFRLRSPYFSHRFAFDAAKAIYPKDWQ